MAISAIDSRTEIAQNPDLAKYHLTVKQSLNDEAFKAMAVHSGLKLEEGALPKALDAANTIAGIAIPIPVVSQLTQLALSGAHFAASQIEKNNNSTKAEKFLAINPEHDPVEWKKFVDELATELTIKNKDKIEHCPNISRGDNLVANLQAFFQARPHKSEQDERDLAIKALALRDSSKIIETVVNEKDLVGNVGIEDDKTRENLVNHLVESVANRPSPTTKSLKTIPLAETKFQTNYLGG